ncbi:hypothetical protein [Nocardioides sp. SYSU D00038]|uniref:hypothetical protein n=1 Tax=Nocardioides sp. SYSU D00038 TaxID=2812554 RepID=UPI001966E48C|nr:hypothetical protein [Nocardioides sp. SYSU D00038]
MDHHARSLTVLLAAGALAWSLGACSGDDEPTSSPQPSGTDPGSVAATPSDPTVPDPTATPSPAGGGSEGEPAAPSDAPSTGAQDPTPIPADASDEPTRGAGGEQTDVLEALEGDARPGCVPVRAARDVRSGGFGAGPFDDLRRTFRPGRAARLYLVPQHSEEMPGVVLTARHTGSGATVEVAEDHVSDADQFLFYDVELRLPRAGTWELRAAAGPDRGCWRVTLD